MAKINNILSAQEKKQETKKFSVQMIHYSKLEPSADNRYTVDQVEELANMILLSGGVKQNLLARKKTPDTYTIIAGHRRRAAVRYLVEDRGLDQFALVPVHVENTDDIIAKLDLILTNAGCRVRNDWEKMMEVNELYELLAALKCGSDQDKAVLKLMTGMDPDEIGGREIRAIVAEKLGMGETKVANLRNIEANLSPELKERFKEGDIGISVANEAAGLPPEKQKELEEKETVKLADVKAMKAVSESDTDADTAEERHEELPVERVFPRTCITGRSPYGNCVCCGNNGVSCCAECSEGCNGRCGWLDETVPGAEEKTENLEAEDDDACIYDLPVECPVDAACEEICCEDCLREDCDKRCHEAHYPHCLGTPPWEKKNGEHVASEPLTVDSVPEYDRKLLLEIMEKESEVIETMQEYWSENQPMTLTKHRMMMDAYKMLLKYHDSQSKSEPIIQMELPKLKNNDQRKEWINNYKEWPVWFTVPEASEIYYRYDFADGSSFVICEYRYYVEWMEKYRDMDPEATGTREYILKPGYRYLQDCSSNTTAMIEHLKEVQKR